MNESLDYKNADAFRDSLSARFKQASIEKQVPVNELRRQFAYDRLLTRLFTIDPNSWVLKGGGLLLARLPQQARHSLDLDMYYTKSIDKAVEQLRKSGNTQTFKDFFTFDITPGHQITKGMNIKVTAYLGSTIFEQYRIDVAVDANMTQEPDLVLPLTPIKVPGIISQKYRGYPIVDHIADKHAAMLEKHDGNPSSRYRDLVDLVLIANTTTIKAADLNQALYSEYKARNLTPPKTVTVPSPDWQKGYTKIAKTKPNLKQQTLTEALETVQDFLNPILTGQTTGTWQPETQNWI